MLKIYLNLCDAVTQLINKNLLGKVMYDTCIFHGETLEVISFTVLQPFQSLFHVYNCISIQIKDIAS